jgi:hypothetical protein
MSEVERLAAANNPDTPWKKWGPYLSERQWGTVREDYSNGGDAWDFFTHDHARSRSYKWGEDGLAGISDDAQILCFALAFWNGNDPILKERLFGLANSEGNHGEDVKEYYFYLDSTPTHSYMKYLYKYPQGAYPYDDIVKTNASRSREELEYELLDTGIFDDDRYFDIFVEYAKAGPDDILIRVEAVNRGDQDAPLHILPHLWFRNTWWRNRIAKKEVTAPTVKAVDALAGGDEPVALIQASDETLGTYYLLAAGADETLFTNNETNHERIFGDASISPYVKDAFHNYLVAGKQDAVNPERFGTKSAALYRTTVPAGGSVVVKLRLTRQQPVDGAPVGAAFDQILADRRAEADAFYAGITPEKMSEDEARVLRQAMAGMLWTKQFYSFDLDYWLHEHDANPLAGGKRAMRNSDWYHMFNNQIISMPDKWEYPWYAAWDLAFHTIALSAVDEEFAADQLRLMLRDAYLHPNGQIPAYEWNFGDVNPPVHAFATLFNLTFGKERSETSIRWARYAFNRLLLNFAWWVNRKDPAGRSAFNGGFLGLDNIGVFDRSSPLPTGGYLEQADGTAWMAFFSQNMFELALEIAMYDPDYEEFMVKFLRHFLTIAGSMDRMGENADEMWDEEDGFYYDVLILPDGNATRIKIHSLVGLLPFAAVSSVRGDAAQKFPILAQAARAFAESHPELTVNIHPFSKPGKEGRYLLSVLNEKKLRRILGRMLDENAFFSEYGIRSLSREHLENPYIVRVEGKEHRVAYLPAESDNGMFGGNSNWRGPVWAPLNLMFVRALLQYYSYYGDDFKVEMPTGSGNLATLYEVAEEITRRLGSIFLRNEAGERPVFGGARKFQEDPHWRDNLLFYEYFHGDNGAGLGASHQTGWTATIARLMQFFARITPETVLSPQGRDAIRAALDGPGDAARALDV